MGGEEKMNRQEQLDALKTEFKELLLGCGRENMQGLLDWLETETDFLYRARERKQSWRL